MLIKKEYIKQHLEELMTIWFETNCAAHSFVAKQYWEKNYDFVKEQLPKATLFCKESDEIEGFLGIVENHIAGLFVKEKFQRKGVGKALLEEAKQQFDTLSLSVFEKNEKAVAFYKAMDFVKIKESIDEQTNQKEYTMLWKKVF